jgi:ABC-type Fe3+ transport system permease subunit
MNIRDYIFYRIYLYYKKKEEIPVFTGIMFLQVMNISLIVLSLGIFNVFTDGLLTNKNENLSIKLLYIVYAIVLMLLLVFDAFRYGRKKSIKELEQKFQHSKLNKKMKLWQIFMIPIAIWIFWFLVIILFENPTFIWEVQ